MKAEVETRSETAWEKFCSDPACTGRVFVAGVALWLASSYLGALPQTDLVLALGATSLAVGFTSVLISLTNAFDIVARGLDRKHGPAFTEHLKYGVRRQLAQ